MTRIPIIIAFAVALAACGGSSTPRASSDVVDYCVARIVSMYEEHHLPYTIDVSARPAACRRWLADAGITTKAQVDVAVRQAEATLP